MYRWLFDLYILLHFWSLNQWQHQHQHFFFGGERKWEKIQDSRFNFIKTNLQQNSWITWCIYNIKTFKIAHHNRDTSKYQNGFKSHLKDEINYKQLKKKYKEIYCTWEHKIQQHFPRKAPVFLPHTPPPPRKCRKAGKLIQKFGKMGDSMHCSHTLMFWT